MKEIPFDPVILTLIADKAQLEHRDVTLADVYKTGTYPEWQQMRDLIEMLLIGRQKEVLNLLLAGKSFSEIALNLGISRGCAQRYYRKGLKRLKKGDYSRH